MVERGGWIELGEGDEFAGYRIERRLGRGGMGILYLAIEPGLDRRVALKLIAPEAAADEVFARRFAEESRIAASIEHPNVVPIYAAGAERGVPYIAMRYVAGSDLGRRIAREGRLPPEQAVELIAQIGNGLDAIHAAGLVHRDVKPANVLLGGEEGAEHAYITDFGVARNVATESGLTQTGRFVGTLDYVAPEQISGGEVDARVDVYALGCLLYKLLTGEVPFPRDGEAARLYAHLHDPPPAPSLHEPSLPMALDDVVIRAMSKPPADRYPSAGDLGRAAVAALSGAPVAVPERTVATGAAATREPATIPPTRESEMPDQPREASTGATTREATTVQAPNESAGRHRVLLAGGGVAVLAAIAVAIVLATSSGEEGGGGEGAAAAQTTNEAKTTKEPKPQPKTLSVRQLIAKGDASCEAAKDDYIRVKEKFSEPETEAGMSVEYAERLVGISSRQVRELRGIEPPKEKQAAFREYLESREEVAEWDEDALRAARANNPAAYVEAYERRNNTEGDRERISDDIGFKVCSQPQ
jgi:Protein kinase domain